MNTETITKPDEQPLASWTPIAVICLAQTLTFLNITGLGASIGPMVVDLEVPAANIQLAMVVYALMPACLLILGGKVGTSFLGLLGAFRAGAATYAVGMFLVATAQGALALMIGEALSGIGSSLMLPTFMGMIAATYRGRQQAAAVGFLGVAVAAGSIGGSLGGGAIAGTLGWRVVFFTVAGIAVLALVLSRLMAATPKPAERPKLDGIGAVLSGSGILLLVVGASQIGAWGFLLASATAPVSLFGLSPVVFLLAGGALLLQAFLASQEKRGREGKEPLLSAQVTDTPAKRSAGWGLFLHQAIFAVLNAALPLYTQLVQGMSPLGSSAVFLPFMLGSVAGALAAARLGVRFAPRTIAIGCFLGFTAGQTLLAFTVSNEWSNLLVLLGLACTGISYGVVGAVLSSALVSACPPALGSDVGGLRGTATNLGTSLGTALTGAILASVLIGSAGRLIEVNPHVGDELRATLQLDLNKVKFMSNDQLEEILDRRTDLNDHQKAGLLEINVQSRLDALRVVFLFTVGIAFLGLFSVRNLPGRPPTVN